MNLNKLNKDQLIDKIKDQEKIKISFGSQIFKDIKILIETLQALFLKLTFLTLIINLIKKYKIVRKVLYFFNWIILSLFGISIIDIYDSNLVLNLIQWIRSNHLYKILIEMLENKTEKVESKVEILENKLEKVESKVEKIESKTENPSTTTSTFILFRNLT